MNTQWTIEGRKGFIVHENDKCVVTTSDETGRPVQTTISLIELPEWIEKIEAHSDSHKGIIVSDWS